MTKHYARLYEDRTVGTQDLALRKRGSRVATVTRHKGYTRPGSVSCQLQDTGNGFIAKFPAHGSTDQDRFVTMDYADACALILALSAFGKELGFDMPEPGR